MRTFRIFAAGSAVLIAGMTWASTAAHERITTTVTWDREIAPIIQARCQSCHGTEASATMPLTTYAEARPWARAIKHQVLTRRMPVWHAARGYGDFANDPSLSPFEIALVTAWVDGGAPKTLPSAAPGTSPAAAVSPVPSSGASAGAAVAGRELTLRCGEQALLPGHLFGLRPQVAAGQSIKVILARPDGTREILGWFRDFDPRFNPTYWLRTPASVPRGSRIIADAPAPCVLTVVLVPTK